jgi:threonine/homoserine/homoserine lactone efflux protein
MAYVVAASILTITPGLDTAMVLRTAIVDGRLSAVKATVGIALVCLIWGAVVSLGLGALLHASALAYSLLKFLGAAYLLLLGIQLLTKPRAMLTQEEDVNRSAISGSVLRNGLLANLLNPKVGLFYVTFLPQFVPEEVNIVSYTFFLAAIHVLLTLTWLGVLIVVTEPIGKFLRRPKAVMMMDRLTGGIFLLFGIKLALSKN